MSFEPRWYQRQAIDAAVTFFTDKKIKGNGLEILPTGSGKSVVIANIAKELPGKTVVLQPSPEILTQNFKKYLSYGFRAGIYSASAGMKYIDDVTFSMIGSIVKKPHLFEKFKNIIIDECHLVNAEKGMYYSFIKRLDHCKVLGLTATPYRLTSGADGAMLKFLNRTNPRIFNKVIYYVQNKILFDEGHLAPLEYYSFNLVDRTRLQANGAGTEFTDQSLRAYYREIKMPEKIAHYANRVLRKRRNLLIFCSLISEAMEVAKLVPGSVVVHGELDPDVRKDIARDFIAGKYSCVVNVKCWDTGFDFPGLEAVLSAFSTMSLARYYQVLGRVIRPFTYPDGSKKTAWYIDLGGNFDLFGKVETMEVKITENGLYSIWNNGRQLTNVTFTKT